MSDVTVEEFELASFFGVEPELLDPDVPWPYNSFLFRTVLDRYEIEFSISPAYRDVSYSIRHNGTVFYALSALSVKDVLYHKNTGGETLEIVITDHERIQIRLRPTLSIVQKVDDGT